MTASATSHASSGSAGRNSFGDRPSPLVRALDRLFPKRGTAPYATLERLVALVIVRAMSLDGDTGDWNCFLSYPNDRAVVRDKRRISEAHAAEARQRTRAAVLPDPVRPDAWPSASVLSLHVGLASRSSSPPRATRLGPNAPRMCSARCAISNPNASHCSDSSWTSAER